MAEENNNKDNGAGLTAEQLQKEFKEHSVAEFFKKNKQMLGLTGKIRTLTTIVHEYCTNSLDACEEARVLPDITVKISELGEEYYEVMVQDNGPGLTKETVGKAFGQLLAGTKFHRRLQQRGQQGIGACMKSDTLVPLADGRILPIKEIVDNQLVGEEVISLDLNSMKLVPGKIVKCWKPKNPLFVKLHTAKGRTIFLTPENPILTLENDKPIWIRADKILEGTCIAAPTTIGVNVAYIQNKNRQAVNAISLEKIVWLEVKKVEFEKNNEKFVYDLEIENHHNFVAGGIICHNSGATMLALGTTGKPIQVITGNGKTAFMAELTIDSKTNQPKIIKVEDLKKEFKGTAVKAKFKEIKYQRSEQGPYEYLRRTAISNPHAQIAFVEPDGTKTVFARTSKEVPQKSVEVPPHPHGMTVDELLEMSHITKARKISAFLKSDFDRMGEKAVEEIQKKMHFDMNKDPKKLVWEEAEEIIKAFKGIQFIAPRTDSLNPIGEERISKSIKEIVEPEFLSVVERKPAVYQGGFAFQVEAGVGFGGNAGRTMGKDETGSEVRKVEIMRFANRVPLLFDSGGCALTKAVQSVDWRRYGIKDLDNAPLTVFIHILSVHIPYTGAGKQAVADDEEVMEELRLALMDTGRKIYRYVALKRREAEKEQKRKLFMKYATEVARGLSELTKEKKDALEKKLLQIVLHRLKIDEEKEQNEEIPEEISEEELAKETKKEKEAKAKKGKKKKSRLSEESGE